MKSMRCKTALLSTALLASLALKAQPQPNNPGRDIASQSQAILESTKAQLIGSTFCRHVIDATTFVDALAFGRTGLDSFIVRWLDPNPGSPVHTAVYSPTLECLAKDGDTVDGKRIVQILPNSLASSAKHRLIGWEALYEEVPIDRASSPTLHRGAFTESKFSFELDPVRASTLDSFAQEPPDYGFDDNREVLIPRPGVLRVATRPQAPATPATQPPSSSQTNPPRKLTLPTIPCLPFQKCSPTK
jgi:hypothetical protein